MFCQVPMKIATLPLREGMTECHDNINNLAGRIVLDGFTRQQSL